MTTERERFEAWLDGEGAVAYEGQKVNFAWAAWQAALAQPAQPVVDALDKAVKAIYAMTDALRPPPAGSFARGEHEGICAAARTVADMRDKARAAPQPAPAAERSTDGAQESMKPACEENGSTVSPPSTPSTAEPSDDTEAIALALGPIALILRGRGFPNGAEIVERAAALIRAGRATVAGRA